MKTIRLKINERVNRGEGTSAWANYLLNVGDGTEKTDEYGFIKIPDEILARSQTMEDFVQEIYPHLGKQQIHKNK